MVIEMEIGARYDCNRSLLKYFICKETIDILVSNSNLLIGPMSISSLTCNGNGSYGIKKTVGNGLEMLIGPMSI